MARLGSVVGTLAGEEKKPRTKARKAPRKQDGKTVQVNFLLRPEQRRAVKLYAVENDMHPSEVVRQALDKFFRGRKQGR